MKRVLKRYIDSSTKWVLRLLLGLGLSTLGREVSAVSVLLIWVIPLPLSSLIKERKKGDSLLITPSGHLISTKRTKMAILLPPAANMRTRSKFLKELERAFSTMLGRVITAACLHMDRQALVNRTAWSDTVQIRLISSKYRELCQSPVMKFSKESSSKRKVKNSKFEPQCSKSTMKKFRIWLFPSVVVFEEDWKSGKISC